jgi:2,3-diketo-5-methylthio-1-phosphopentane phosphatase
MREHGPARKILVTDFDGTLTRRDVYQLIAERLLPAGTPDFWADYRAGRITHFEALRGYFAAAEGGAKAILDLLADVDLEPELAALLPALRRAGWDAVVVSAGCRWYIDRVLGPWLGDVEVHANPGEVDRSGRLVMEWPVGSPFFSPETGIDKVAVVRAKQSGGRTVAFAGDGPPDLGPALCVPGPYRFARAGSLLAESLGTLGEPSRPFNRWADVARALLAMATP